MATYGRGQMLGSGINPESFKQDYSGFARAAEMQAQGMSDLGASIGGAIKDFGEEKKKINQDIAKGKSALQFAKANYPELAGRIDEIGKIFSDVNVSKADQAAAGSQMGEFVTAMIRGQEFNTEVELKKRALGIQEAEALARNEPPMPTPLTYKRATNVPYGGGFLDNLLIGSDGEYYDEARNLVADMGAFARGESPEVYSGYSTFSDDLGSMDTPPVFMPKENPAANIDYASGLRVAPQSSSFPTNLNVPSSAPSLDAGRINARRIDAVLDGGVLPPKQEIAQLERELGIDANEKQNIQSRLRFDADKTEVRALTNAEKQEMKLPAGDYVGRFVDGKLAAPPTIIPAKPDSMERLQENRMLKADDRISTVIESTDRGAERLIGMQEALSLLESGEVKSGSFENIKVATKRFFGIDVASEEQFNSLVGNLAMEAIDLTKGAISDREMTFFREELSPGLRKSVEGNKKIINFKIAAAKRGLRINKVAREMLANNALPADIEAAIKKIQNEDSLIPSSASSDKATPTAPQSDTDRLRAKAKAR